MEFAGFNLVTTSRVQPLMSCLTAVMTQAIYEDSGGETQAVADTATDVTPASGEAILLGGLQRLRSRGHGAERVTADLWC